MNSPDLGDCVFSPALYIYTLSQDAKCPAFLYIAAGQHN